MTMPCRILPAALLLGAALLATPAMAQPLTRITFGTDWRAQAEHGGWYLAAEEGLCRRYGLELTVRQGGPQINVVQQVAAGVVDYQLGSESFMPLNMAREGVPVLAVAALAQKTPRVLLSHRGVGLDTLEQMRGRPIMISPSAREGFWLFLRARYGFTDDQIRPYTFNMAPFLADRNAIMQGFISSEPFKVRSEGNIEPNVILLSDHGFDSYSNLILTRGDRVARNRDQVQGFVNCSIEGWYRYLYHDRARADAAILRDNPEMTQETINNAVQVMRERGIADSGDSLELGLGAMTEARWRSFYELMASVNHYPRDMNWRAAFTLDFVNRRHAIELRR
jgi:NitT/TauT family transport system substrate-binding protein